MVLSESELTIVSSCLADCPKGLRDAVLAACADDANVALLGQGEPLYRQQDPADGMYVVVKGCLEATVTQPDGSEQVVRRISEGEVVGMAELVAGSPRFESVTAADETRLTILPAAAFEKIITTSPESLEAIAAVVRRRLRHNQLAGILPKLFGELTSDALRDIESHVEWIHLRGGEELFPQGAKGDCFYVLVSGRLRAIARIDDGGRQPLGEVAPGEALGEMALITGEPRSAAILAIRDSELAKFSVDEFQWITEQYPRVMMNIARTLIGRLRSPAAPSSSHNVINIAVIPFDGQVATEEFASRLVSALSSFGPVLQLCSKRLNSLLGIRHAAEIDVGDPGYVRLSAWLNEQESKYRFVLYVADERDSAWRRRCIRQADRVLFLADGHQQVTGDVERSGSHAGDRISAALSQVVMIHPNAAILPSGTEVWMAALDADTHYHLRWDHREDFQRLGRLLAGRSVGLALGGGGARGFSHIGVIRALREAGIPIDIVGGTSMGAIIGGAYAMGMDWETIYEKCRQGWVIEKPMRDYTLPIFSLLRSRKIDRLTYQTYGDAQIEDLWLKFFCVSTNLTTARVMLHEQGGLAKAIRASASLPGIVPPIIHEGNLLVDGGVLNNIPGDIMRAQGAGVVIAVNVNPTQDLCIPQDEMPSPWSALWRKLLPFATPLEAPSMLSVLMRTATLSSIECEQALKDCTDCYLCLPLGSYGMLEFKAIDEVMRIGYETAQKMIPQWIDDGIFEGIV